MAGPALGPWVVDAALAAATAVYHRIPAVASMTGGDGGGVRRFAAGHQLLHQRRAVDAHSAAGRARWMPHRMYRWSPPQLQGWLERADADALLAAVLTPDVVDLLQRRAGEAPTTNREGCHSVSETAMGQALYDVRSGTAAGTGGTADPQPGVLVTTRLGGVPLARERCPRRLTGVGAAPLLQTARALQAWTAPAGMFT